ALLMASHVRRRGGLAASLVLGGVLGVATLVRQVGVCWVAAVSIDLFLARRKGSALLVLLASAIVLAPWAYWVATVAHEPQVAIMAREGWKDTLASNALFYLRRVPDALVGPLIEVGTVFRPDWERPATWLAALGTGTILGGWTRGGGRRRLSGLT